MVLGVSTLWLVHEPDVNWSRVKSFQREKECRTHRIYIVFMNCLLLMEYPCVLKCIAAGDLGQTDWMASTLEHIAGYDYHILLFAGDLSYADKNQFLWDTFGHMVSASANYQPWMVTEGNHEIKDNPLMESFVSTTPAGTCLTRRADHVQTCTIHSTLQGFTFWCLHLMLTSIKILHNINGFGCLSTSLSRSLSLCPSFSHRNLEQWFNAMWYSTN